jgi:hypothetical protein
MPIARLQVRIQALIPVNDTAPARIPATLPAKAARPTPAAAITPATYIEIAATTARPAPPWPLTALAISPATFPAISGASTSAPTTYNIPIQAATPQATNAEATACNVSGNIPATSCWQHLRQQRQAPPHAAHRANCRQKSRKFPTTTLCPNTKNGIAGNIGNIGNISGNISGNIFCPTFPSPTHGGCRASDGNGCQLTARHWPLAEKRPTGSGAGCRAQRVAAGRGGGTHHRPLCTRQKRIFDE